MATGTFYPAETSHDVVTSFLPLTTTYTPSPSCSGVYRLNGPSLVAFDPGYGVDIDPSVQCAPPVMTTWWEQGRFGNGDQEGHTAVSIGPLICPDEWSTVASSVKDKTSTLAMCCPSGYELHNGVPGSAVGDCLSEVAKGKVLTFASTSTDTEAWSTRTTTLSYSSFVGAIAVLGWNIDIATSTSTTLSTSAQSTAQPHQTSLHSNVPSPSSTQQAISSSSTAHPNSINTGTAVGIGVGLALGVVGIVALAVAMCLMRRRKKRKAETDAVPNASYQPQEHISWQPSELQSDGPKSELDGQQHYSRSELEAPARHQQAPAELHG
ncbi:hypothetical protein F4780DRAFT_661830 [Xylariomycetidae sp. FL0641]|nr:hypothetical protein F4780DRAFT_661830 [Xylariomycetidae sp. FL0641]